MLRHFRALIPCERASKFFGQGRDGTRDRIAYGVGPMSCERGPIFNTWANTIGLKINFDSQHEIVPRASVVEVYATYGSFSRERRKPPGLLVAFPLSIASQECALLVWESEPVWVSLTSILPRVLPAVAPFEVWGVEALSSALPLLLYKRGMG